MPSLRCCNYVVLPTSVRSLAQFVGIRGIISVRDLMCLLGSKEFGPVPVYFLGHNTNSIREVTAALGQGANAIEVDVTAYESDLNQLCIDHAGVTGDSPGHSSAPRFEDFLKDLRGVADSRAGQALALVVFDCKPPAATPSHGRTILETVRRLLSDDTGVNVIISVGDVTSSNPYRLDGTSLFDDIALDIHAREGFMIDEEDNPDGVARFFSALGVSRFCYGNGTSDPFSDEGAMVYRIPIERACWLTVTHNEPRFVYAWTVNDIDDQELYFRVGVNGIIADPDGLSHIPGILKEPEYSARFRPALRTDNPFLPPNSAYGLTVRTSDIDKAGTDANVRFTLTGENGSSSVSVDTKYNGRMEAGGVNFVVLPSPDLGALRAITVQRDDNGNAPDWHLDSIEIQSYRFGVNHTALFNCWIGTDKLTRPVS
jgi:glycerophosphoryl diester phosphodiesterase